MVMARYGVERPPLPISLHERRWVAAQERAAQPDAAQGAVFALDDTRKAAQTTSTRGVHAALPARHTDERNMLCYCACRFAT